MRKKTTAASGAAAVPHDERIMLPERPRLRRVALSAIDPLSLRPAPRTDEEESEVSHVSVLRARAKDAGSVTFFCLR